MTVGRDASGSRGEPRPWHSGPKHSQGRARETEAHRMNLHRRRQLIEIVRQQFRLQWQGIHGVPHWGRVRWNGLAMARVNGAREDVVELFAFLHDSQRFHDGTDREHGARAADYTLELNREVLLLDRRGSSC